jgi:hypothetical protein
MTQSRYSLKATSPSEGCPQMCGGTEVGHGTEVPFRDGANGHNRSFLTRPKGVRTASIVVRPGMQAASPQVESGLTVIDQFGVELFARNAVS